MTRSWLYENYWRNMKVEKLALRIHPLINSHGKGRGGFPKSVTGYPPFGNSWSLFFILAYINIALFSIPERSNIWTLETRKLIEVGTRIEQKKLKWKVNSFLPLLAQCAVAHFAPDHSGFTRNFYIFYYCMCEK